LGTIIASDHVGYPLKKAVIEYLTSIGVEVLDLGSHNADTPVDYPDYAQRVAGAVSGGEFECGILVCGTGQGMAIAANHFPGIRASLCYDVYTARQARAHNDANVLCLGACAFPPADVAEILHEWLNTAFEAGIHNQRIAKIEQRLVRPTLLAGKIGVAISPTPTRFGPILFAGELDRGFAAAARAGFQAVELSLRSAKSVDSVPLDSKLKQHRLSLSAIATGQACIEDSLCLSCQDAKLAQATVSHLKSLIDLAAKFGAFVIIGGIRGRLTGDEAEQSQQREIAIRGMRECAQFAREMGVTLLIEPINRYETNFINTARQGLEVIEQVGEPNVKLLLDTFHMNMEEVDIHQTLRTMIDHLGYVHFADSNRWAPGQGHINFGQILDTLSLAGYQGNITAEILPLPDDESAMHQAGLHLLQLLGR
jgi:RpiB/LacA/LacB family sugar-phosphate isomerase